jgi:arabinan endo-1,5-alpha-L-arabinosidase
MSRSARRGLAIAALGALLVAGASACAAGGPPAAETAEDAPLPFVLDADFPDPDVLRTGDDYYAYATNGSGFNVQVATSTDLDEWSPVAADALPLLPGWSLPGKTWAPDVSEPVPGSFVMYFTVANATPQLQCIAVAVATPMHCS